MGFFHIKRINLNLQHIQETASLDNKTRGVKNMTRHIK